MVRARRAAPARTPIRRRIPLVFKIGLGIGGLIATSLTAGGIIYATASSGRTVYEGIIGNQRAVYKEGLGTGRDQENYMRIDKDGVRYEITDKSPRTIDWNATSRPAFEDVVDEVKVSDPFREETFYNRAEPNNQRKSEANKQVINATSKAYNTLRGQIWDELNKGEQDWYNQVTKGVSE